MDINEKGKVVSHQIAETVINVNERMCYTDVKNILEDTDEEAKKRYEALIPMFFMMKELSGILRNSRHHRAPLTLIFRRARLFLMQQEKQSMLSHMKQMWQPKSLKISC